MKLFRRIAALTLCLALLLCGCAAESGNTAQKEEPAANGETAAVESAVDENAVITLAQIAAWDTLCPLASTTQNADFIVKMIFSPLFEADGKGGFAGRLGESFEMVDDYKAMVVHLREGVTWHDGEPFDADDVMFSVDLYTDNSYTSSRRLFFQDVEGCTTSGAEESENSAHVEKIDQYTVKFYFKSRVSAAVILDQQRPFVVLPEHLLKDADPATILDNDFWTKPVGTGAFTLESQVPGESLTLAANKDYFLGAPKFAKLVVKVIPNANLVTSMMSNDVDIIMGSLGAIPDTDYELATTIDGYTVDAVKGSGAHYLVLNNDIFNSAKIRKAIAMTLDKETMINSAVNGNGFAAYTPYSGSSIYYDDAIAKELGYSYDLDAAKKMLEEENFDFSRTYTIAINDNPVRKTIVTVWQQSLAAIGVKLEIKTLDTQTCIAQVREGEVDMWINGSSNSNTSNMNTGFANWVSINEDGSLGNFNLSRVREPEFMELEKKLAASVTDEEIQQAASEIQRKLLTDYNYIWLIGTNLNYAVSNRVQGIDIDQMLAQTGNYEDWFVAK